MLGEGVVHREADGGTLFADEIGNLSLEGRAMLVRAIEQGDVRPVGGYVEPCRKTEGRRSAGPLVF